MKPLRVAQIFFAGCALTVAGSQWLLSSRRYVAVNAVDLSSQLPSAIGDWKEIPTAQPIVDPNQQDADQMAIKAYDKVEYHTYRRADGTEVVLTLAYRRVQEQESKIHRPELCYFAEGYAIRGKHSLRVPADGRAIPAVTFQAVGPERSESVVYWIRIGSLISTSPWVTRTYLLEQGLERRVPDGLLVRASIFAAPDAGPDVARENVAIVTRFLQDLVNNAGPNRAFFAGRA